MGHNEYGQYRLEAKWSWGDANLGQHVQGKLGYGAVWPWGIDRNLVIFMR